MRDVSALQLRAGHLEKKLPVRFHQEQVSLSDGTRYVRRAFTRLRESTQPPPPSRETSPPDKEAGQTVTITDNPLKPGRFSYIKRADIVEKSFMGNKFKMMIAENADDPTDLLGLRIGHDFSGYSQWMNELQVNLLPNFYHDHVLPNYGSDPRDDPIEFTFPEIHESEATSTTPKGSREADTRDQGHSQGRRLLIEYWLVYRFHNCVTLREYLRSNTISWPQLIGIARGIFSGLNYLHDGIKFDNLETRRMTCGFMRENCLSKVTFSERNSKIVMQPKAWIAVIHRNLSSLSVVVNTLTDDLKPSIWNFGLAQIHYPFQPSNNRFLMDEDAKRIVRCSPYSPPEVLEDRGHLTLNAMKAIDMYAGGLVLWELMSRCRMPYIEDGSDEDNELRANPATYREPFELELGERPVDPDMLEYAVCQKRARPALRNCWLSGEKSNRLAQTMQDLWDQDFDARILSCTAINRLDRLDLSERDRRNKYSSRTSYVFERETMWPAEMRGIQAPPFPKASGPNIVIEDPSALLRNEEYFGPSVEVSEDMAHEQGPFIIRRTRTKTTWSRRRYGHKGEPTSDNRTRDSQPSRILFSSIYQPADPDRPPKPPSVIPVTAARLAMVCVPGHAPALVLAPAPASEPEPVKPATTKELPVQKPTSGSAGEEAASTGSSASTATSEGRSRKLAARETATAALPASTAGPSPAHQLPTKPPAFSSIQTFSLGLLRRKRSKRAPKTTSVGPEKSLERQSNY